MAHGLSKSRFVAGWQCHKQLWWRVHDPGAQELQPDKVLQDLFDQGQLVGERAREQFPGGVLIDVPRRDYDAQLEATRRALEAGAPAIFEAAFREGGVFAAIDVLLRTAEGFTLIEVKSSSSVKDEHIPDAAVQTWVVERAGLPVRSIEIMHLNKEYRLGGAAPLFVLEDVTERVRAFLPEVPGMVEDQLQVLTGPLPERAIGLHCSDPRECPFRDRCWPDDPEHISRLYNTGAKRTAGWMASGVHRIPDIPAGAKLPDAARRQVRALREGRMVVEPGLAKALEPFVQPLGFLDFETVNRAIPRWEGLPPWGAAAAQFSYHELRGDELFHREWLAEGPVDPRRALAEAMLEATAGARAVVTYTSYEKTQLKALQGAVPDLAESLGELIGKLVDLHPVIRDQVYHPDFGGSFSLKYVLTPLVPDLTYNDLVIVDGLVASVEIARLLFVEQRIPPHERERLRRDLLEYCKRDTEATVRLYQRLVQLAVA